MSTNTNWIEDIESGYKDTILLFHHDDISDSKPTEEHITKIISSVFGKFSAKVKDKRFREMVLSKHEEVRKRVSHESTPLVLSLFCGLASIAGMKASGGGGFHFRNISNDITDNWSHAALLRTFFVLRAAWDENPTWILHAETYLMKLLGYEYKGHRSQLKKMGWVAKVLSRTKTRKLREANDNIARNCGYKFTITRKGAEGKQRRIIANLNLTLHFVPSENNIFQGKRKPISSLLTSDELGKIQESDKSYDLRKVEGVCINENAFKNAAHLLLYHNDEAILGKKKDEGKGKEVVIKKEKNEEVLLKDETKKKQAKEEENQTEDEDYESPVQTHTGKRKQLRKLHKKQPKPKKMKYNDSDFEDDSVFEGSQDVSNFFSSPKQSPFTRSQKKQIESAEKAALTPKSPFLTRNRRQKINAAQKAALKEIEKCGQTFIKKLEATKIEKDKEKLAKVSAFTIILPI